MIVDALELASGATLNADVCIVGGGPAGISLALSLSGAGFSVLLLESGGLDEEPQTQALHEGTMSGLMTWELDEKRFRLLGGGSSRWAGWCRPLAPEDFTERQHIPMSGWPITFEELIPYYERAQERLQLGPFEYDAAAVSTSERPLLVSPHGRLMSTFFQFSPPTRFGTAYRSELEQADGVTVQLHANAVRIELESGLGSVSRLDCATLEGASFTIEANTYVLAAGAIENARLLLASSHQLPQGVANSSDFVGRCFMEHPHYGDGGLLVAPRDADFSFYSRHQALVATDGRDVSIRGAIGLQPQIRAAEGLPAFTATLREVPLERETGELLATQVQNLVELGRGDNTAHTLYARVEQTPDPESRITLTEELDALGVPRVDLSWTIRSEDHHNLARSMDILGAELAAAGLGRLWTPRDAEGAYQWTPNPGGHHMGTTRMSTSSATGVVDANCRTFDVNNLYLAGSSVFTTGGEANPTLTIVALAERLADHLRSIA